jgi:hypothetical protein
VRVKNSTADINDRAAERATKIRNKNKNQRLPINNEAKGFEGVRGNEYLNKQQKMATTEAGKKKT